MQIKLNNQKKTNV